MLISHKHRFIFIKTRKTGGSSIERVLLDELAGTDYVFGGMPPEGLAPHNCEPAEHLGWKWIQRHYPTCWETYFKFAVDRDPWDKCVSAHAWYMMHTGHREAPFRIIVRKHIRKLSQDWDLYADGNRILVDRLIRYEEMHQQLPRLCIPGLGNITRTWLKSTGRPNNRNRLPWVGHDDLRDRVAHMNRRVIRQLKYNF